MIRKMQEITRISITNTEEYKYIIKRIKDRAQLGYNYVKVAGDSELYDALTKYSIFPYLQSLGYDVSYQKIEWKF